MAPNPLKGLYITSGKRTFVFAVIKEVKGLNFLEDTNFYNNPTQEFPQIGPKVFVEWTK